MVVGEQARGVAGLLRDQVVAEVECVVHIGLRVVEFGAALADVAAAEGRRG
jgi:hypothetical protein